LEGASGSKKWGTTLGSLYVPISNPRLPDYVRVLAPASANAWVPIFIVSTGLFAAWIQKVRFSKWFFSALAFFFGILILF
jgi:hypothetical protein